MIATIATWIGYAVLAYVALMAVMMSLAGIKRLFEVLVVNPWIKKNADDHYEKVLKPMITGDHQSSENRIAP